jgi:hypothetical protein
MTIDEIRRRAGDEAAELLTMVEDDVRRDLPKTLPRQVKETIVEAALKNTCEHLESARSLAAQVDRSRLEKLTT